jgi:hypothetical protein
VHVVIVLRNGIKIRINRKLDYTTHDYEKSYRSCYPSGAPPVFSEVRVAQSLVFYAVLSISLFVLLSFSFDRCILCLSIYWLPLCIVKFPYTVSKWCVASWTRIWLPLFGRLITDKEQVLRPVEPWFVPHSFADSSMAREPWMSHWMSDCCLTTSQQYVS